MWCLQFIHHFSAIKKKSSIVFFNHGDGSFSQHQKNTMANDQSLNEQDTSAAVQIAPSGSLPNVRDMVQLPRNHFLLNCLYDDLTNGAVLPSMLDQIEAKNQKRPPRQNEAQLRRGRDDEGLQKKGG